MYVIDDFSAVIYMTDCIGSSHGITAGFLKSNLSSINLMENLSLHNSNLHTILHSNVVPYKGMLLWYHFYSSDEHSTNHVASYFNTHRKAAQLETFWIPLPYSTAQKKPKRERKRVQNGYENMNGKGTKWISNWYKTIRNKSKKGKSIL